MGKLYQEGGRLPLFLKKSLSLYEWERDKGCEVCKILLLACNPFYICAGARVHLYHIALIDEGRDIYRGARFQFRGFILGGDSGGPGGDRALDYFEFDECRDFNLQRPVSEHCHCDVVAFLNEEPLVAEGLFIDIMLFEAPFIHYYVLVAFFKEVLSLVGLGADIIHFISGAIGPIDDGVIKKISQLESVNGLALARLHKLVLFNAVGDVINHELGALTDVFNLHIVLNFAPQ
jgi:hypothetical protein